jgi:hypothetical protein
MKSFVLCSNSFCNSSFNVFSSQLSAFLHTTKLRCVAAFVVQDKEKTMTAGVVPPLMVFRHYHIISLPPASNITAGSVMLD